MCLSNIEVIGQYMADIQLLPVSENKGGPKIQKSQEVTRLCPLTPFDPICIFSVRAFRSQYVHKMASWSDLMRLRYCDFTISPIWLKVAYSRPFWGGFGGIFSPNGTSLHSYSKMALLVRKHVVWTIKRVRQSRGLTCGEGREKNKDSQLSHKSVIFHVFEENILSNRSAPKIWMWGNVLDVVTCAKF